MDLLHEICTKIAGNKVQHWGVWSSGYDLSLLRVWKVDVQGLSPTMGST